METSEIVTGLLMAGGYINPKSVSPDDFCGEYAKIVKIIREKSDWDLADLVTGAGLSTVRAAQDAVASLNGLKEKTDWVRLLQETKVLHDVSGSLELISKKLKRGEKVDATKLIDIASKLATNKGNLVRMSDVEASQIKFIKTGYAPIDFHLGGIPEIGLVTVAAPPKTGKTSFLMALSGSFAKRYKDKNVVIFTAEMLMSEYKARAQEIDPLITRDVMDRIILCDDVMSVDDIATKAASVDNIGLLGVDFADLLIQGDVDTNAMEKIYRTLAIAAKQLHIPVILLGQLSGNYQGGIPRPHHIRWTRLAEALSWLLIMLYAPSRDYFADDMKKSGKTPELPTTPGKAYIIAWLCRGGFRVHQNPQEYPGAIQLNWMGEQAWSSKKGTWFSLAKGQSTQDDDEDDDD